ncbi:hypothetical protein BDN67DRAFT_79312 [Paxillus ammoniavirescens]|nr:hypothetical protein BDN67DRAFT_79312 [Paxillus ammoniavirescens]
MVVRRCVHASEPSGSNSAKQFDKISQERIVTQGFKRGREVALCSTRTCNIGPFKSCDDFLNLPRRWYATSPLDRLPEKTGPGSHVTSNPNKLPIQKPSDTACPDFGAVCNVSQLLRTISILHMVSHTYRPRNRTRCSGRTKAAAGPHLATMILLRCRTRLGVLISASWLSQRI